MDTVVAGITAMTVMEEEEETGTTADVGTTGETGTATEVGATMTMEEEAGIVTMMTDVTGAVVGGEMMTALEVDVETTDAEAAETALPSEGHPLLKAFLRSPSASVKPLDGMFMHLAMSSILLCKLNRLVSIIVTCFGMIP
jgi:hypothetical protein